jgi:hypothetical protein
MMRLRLLVAALVILSIVTISQPAAAQSDESQINLVVSAGRPLRVALDERVQLKNVGQSVTGTVVEPVYAYDRIVIAKGTRVRGQITGIDSGSAFVRTRAYLAGNFSPPKHAVLQFDTLLLDDGREMSIDTVVKGGVPNVKRETAGGARSGPIDGSSVSASAADVEHPALMARARSELVHRAGDALSETKQKASDTFAFIKSVREPGQMSRLKDAAVQQLPYHPQYLARGTIYDAELAAPISFGSAVPAPAAPAGTAPAPDSLLTARLATTLDSSKTPRGTPFEAVITETVFSNDQKVIFPEGTKLTGEVTFATPARRFHRNGRLRFLFESVQVPNQAPAPLAGALHAIDASSDDRVALDDEGGATLENSNTRFIAPALAILALHASMDRDGQSHPDPDGDGSIKTAGSGAGARGIGGFIGMGFFGAAVSQITRPVGIAMGVYGAARTIYTNVLGKGREVTFPADTPIQVRLAPGPAAR